jgi:hypothetical protein
MIYRGYRIKFDPPPIPVRNMDWDWCPVDYDGPEDPRGGRASSMDDAKAWVDEELEELCTTQPH